MIIYETRSPVVVVTDFALESDADYDREHSTSNSVLRLWSAPKRYIRQSRWDGLTKVALFSFNTKFKPPADATAKEKTAFRKKTGAMRDAARAELEAYLRKRKPKLIVVLQTRSQTARKNKDIESAEVEGVDGTMCWTSFKAPGSIPTVMGTIFQSPFGPCMGMPNPVNYEFVYDHLIRLWFQGALAYGQMGETAMLQCKEMYYTRDTVTEGLQRVLASAQRGVPIAFDIESASSQNLITAIGLSDGVCGVSVPWDQFEVAGQHRTEPGRTHEWERLTRQVLATGADKYAHNGVGYDIPFLERRGIPVAGRVVDSFILHALVFKQYRAGLQQAVSQLFLIHPWKDQFKPSAAYSKDDEDFWTCDPMMLREYNVLDSFFTHHLVTELKWRAGIK